MGLCGGVEGVRTYVSRDTKIFILLGFRLISEPMNTAPLLYNILNIHFNPATETLF
jgi:hypothetical protein